MRFIFGFILLFFAYYRPVSAQPNHYIYIESENKQPFYVVLNKTIYSANTGGYVIIPQLKSQVYQLQIGFPRNQSEELTFYVNIDNSDYGFILQSNSSNRWSLVNLLTFNTILAGDSIVSITQTPKELTQKNILLVSNDVIIKPDLQKINEQVTNEGLTQTYIDKIGNASDTIALIIPKTQKKLIPVDAKNNCILASEEDFKRFRLQMAAASNESEMLLLADKSLKQFCYSTEQIKNIGVLFIDQKNRLSFFLVAKPYLYDIKNFGQLETQFSEPSLIAQFRKAQQ